MPAQLTVRDCVRLRKAGDSDQALARLRELLRDPSAQIADFERAGRLLRKILAEEGVDRVDFHVRWVGQCTTSYLLPHVVAEAWARGVGLRVSEAEYDNVIQDLSSLEESPDVLVLMPWHQRLLGTGVSSSDERSSEVRSAEVRLDDELTLWRTAWQVAAQSGARLVQVGYDWLGTGSAGYHLGSAAGGDLAQVRQLNAELRRDLPRAAWFVDLEAISATVGHGEFYDRRGYYWTKNPWSAQGLRTMAQHLWAGIRALTTGPKKVLALDLDNTLWGGVVGETGPLGVRLGESPDGEAHRDLQAWCKRLSQRGVLLTVASKNNPEDAAEPFGKHPDMILGREDFAAFHATWGPKSESLRQMAADLSLGLDSFVFLDDNPAERHEVRLNAPEVEVVEVGEDPATFITALEQSLFFESAEITDEDRRRSQEYQSRRQRQAAEQAAGSLDDYMRSLEMRAEIQPLSDGDMPRAVQLLGKTNQFNLTTRRHSEARVRGFLEDSRSFALTLRLEDRFGDYGLIALTIGVPTDHDDSVLEIDTFLMSCRAINRTVEHQLINHVIAKAGECGFEAIEARYQPTAKNRLVANLYSDFGFETVQSSDDEILYRLTIATYQPNTTFVSAP